MKLTKHDAMVAGGSIVFYKLVEVTAKTIYNRFFTETGKAEAAVKAAKKADEKKLAAEKKAFEAQVKAEEAAAKKVS